MTPKDHLSHDERLALVSHLQSRLADALRGHSTHAQDESQAESAREVLMQDADDVTQRAGAHEVDATLADAGRIEIDALSAALERTHGGGYGICVDCHLPIPFTRLSVEPQALRCTTCQTLQERKLATHAPSSPSFRPRAA